MSRVILRGSVGKSDSLQICLIYHMVRYDFQASNTYFCMMRQGKWMVNIELETIFLLQLNSHQSLYLFDIEISFNLIH